MLYLFTNYQLATCGWSYQAITSANCLMKVIRRSQIANHKYYRKSQKRVSYQTIFAHCRSQITTSFRNCNVKVVTASTLSQVCITVVGKIDFK